MAYDDPYVDQQQFPTLGSSNWSTDTVLPGAQIPQEFSGMNYDYGGSSNANQTGYGNTYDNTGYMPVATDPNFNQIGNGDTSFNNYALPGDQQGNGQLQSGFGNNSNQNGFGSQLGQGLGQFGQWALGGGANNALGALPLAGMAAQQFNDARRYENIGRDAQQAADPFGPQRGQYQTMLSNIYNDPAKVLADPQHQAIMNSQLDAIQARNRAGGYMGGGKDFTDMSNYAAQENAKYLNDEKARLAQLSGAQFDPANGAAMYMKGAELGMGAQNNALGALGMMYQNAMGTPQGLQNRPGMPGQGGGMPQGMQQALQNSGYTPQQLQQMATGQMGKAGLDAYQKIINGTGQGGGSFTPNLQSPYWNQYTPGNYNTDQIAQQELGVTQGNLGSQYDEFGGLNTDYQNAMNMGPNLDQFNTGTVDPFQQFNLDLNQGSYDIGSANFDPFAWDLG